MMNLKLKFQEQNTEVLHLNVETTIEMSEFQVVNKKKKSRKRRNEPASPQTQDLAPQTSAPARNRRKSSCSMPVSDKSDSSDLDSVHSLPVSAKLANTSYANVMTQSKEVAVTENSEKVRRAPLLNSVEFPELTKVNNSVVVCDRRPAVIIPVSNKDSEVSGLTFGFEINEQLLALEPDCENDICVNTADSFTARYIQPVVLNNYNHDKIVSYVGQGKNVSIFKYTSQKYIRHHSLFDRTSSFSRIFVSCLKTREYNFRTL